MVNGEGLLSSSLPCLNDEPENFPLTEPLVGNSVINRCIPADICLLKVGKIK